MNLLKLFPSRDPDSAVIDEFNRLVDYEYDRVRDFLILHYHLNRRDDTELWRYCGHMEIPESLQVKMQMFRHRGYVDAYRYGLFAPPSWIAVFVGQGLVPEGFEPFAANLPLDRVLAEIGGLSHAIDQRVELMPDHGQFVADYCPAAAQ